MQNEKNGVEKSTHSRRKFIKKLASGTLGVTAALSGGGLIESVFGEDNSFSGSVGSKSKVINVKSAGVIKDKTPKPEIVEKMVNEGIMRLTGKNDIGEAWSQFVSKDDVVGLKINPIGMKRLSTHPELVNAIINGLIIAGVKPNNIIVWDRFEEHLEWAGYKFNNSAEGVRYYSTEHNAGYDQKTYYTSDKDKPGKRDKEGNVSYFSNILTKDITTLINVPVLKDHNITGATLCLKNIAYGVVNNTRRFHPAPYFCDPMTAEVCSHPAVTSKLKLHILDCLRACFDGGPVDMKPFAIWNEERIMFSADPVAIDQLGLETIEKKRRENNKSSILHRAKYIKTAAKMGLGTNKHEEIDLVDVEV
ncbi:MAG: DUF362 domain-containing protein [Candidatus Anammoxibacter sp.]